MGKDSEIGTFLRFDGKVTYEPTPAPAVVKRVCELSGVKVIEVGMAEPFHYVEAVSQQEANRQHSVGLPNNVIAGPWKAR